MSSQGVRRLKHPGIFNKCLKRNKQDILTIQIGEFNSTMVSFQNVLQYVQYPQNFSLHFFL